MGSGVASTVESDGSRGRGTPDTASSSEGTLATAAIIQTEDIQLGIINIGHAKEKGFAFR